MTADALADSASALRRPILSLTSLNEAKLIDGT